MQTETCIQVESSEVTMRLLDAKGNVGMLAVSDVEQLRRQFWNCKICDKHKVVCRSRKAYRLHLQEEHSY